MFLRLGRPYVRVWALAGPLLVLIIAAPFVRPLFQPGVVSDRELIALQAVRSVLHRGTLAINPRYAIAAETFRSPEGVMFSKDPPVYLLAISGVAWLIERAGVTFERNPYLLEYLLIFFAITTPTAVASALLYRVSRIFGLRRSVRLGLALTCVLATGWVSYSVVLLPHALAAALLAGTVFGCAQVILAEKPKRAIAWLFPGGFCAAAAAAIEPAAIIALLVLPLATFVLPLKVGWRFNALLVLLLGMAGPLVLHASVNTQITGDLMPPRWHVAQLGQSDAVEAEAPPVSVIASMGSDELEPVDPTIWFFLGRAINRLLTFTIGSHGFLSHFPVLLLGIVGAGMIVHRHWQRGIKALAGGSLVILVILLGYKMFAKVDAIDLNFAAPRLVIVAPLLMIWAGAWLRREHSGLVWTLAGIAMSVSVISSLLGATSPAPPGGYQRYSVAEAAARLIHSRYPEAEPMGVAAR